MMAKISVIVPCYNQAQYLDECLQSVLDQTYEDWECIIINDGSPDNTEEVAKKWVEKDHRFKYFFKNNGGVSAARNYGIERAKGEWILPLDGDDYIASSYMKVASNFFKNEDIKMIYGKARKFDLVNEDWILPTFSLKTLASLNIIHNSSFFKKEYWQIIANYDEKLVYGYEDWDLWISLLKNGGTVKYIDEICLYYRIKQTSRSVELFENTKLDETLKHIQKKHFDFFSRYLLNWHHYRNGYYNYKTQYDKINNNIFGKVLIRLINIFTK